MSYCSKGTVSRGELTEAVRRAIEDRATWFKLLLDNAQKGGVNAEELARKSIFEFGKMKGARMNPTTDLQSFVKEFANPIVTDVFQMEIKEAGPEKAVIEFNYCPLMQAWDRLGATPEEHDRLCDWAMEGDRGLMTRFPGFDLDIQTRKGKGDPVCRLVFTLKKR